MSQVLPSPAAGTPAAPPSPPAPSPGLPPAIPTASGSSTSAAALAAGVPKAFDDSRDLRVGPPREGASWAQAGLPSAPGGDAGSARLRGPEPVVEPVSRRDPMQSPPAGLGSDTYKQLQAQLAARGVTWQRLETWGEDGEWQFSCSIPSKQNPNVRRKYEARARSDLDAIQAVLKQIEKEN